jgi:ATP-dependent Clp protease protease subunit
VSIIEILKENEYMNEAIFMNEKGVETMGMRLLKERSILLFGTIDQEKAANVISSMLYLEAVDANMPIKLYINSTGGDETDALAIFDLMRGISCPVHTICLGKAHGMAALILAGGAKGERSAYKNSEIMLTQVSRDRTFGQASDIELETAHLLEIKNRVNLLLAEITDRECSEIFEAMERKHWLFADQALQSGLIDKIVG